MAELLLRAVEEGNLTVNFILVVVIGGMSWFIKKQREDIKTEKEEKDRILTEGQGNLSWYQSALDRYQNTIDRLIDKNGS